MLASRWLRHTAGPGPFGRRSLAVLIVCLLPTPVLGQMYPIPTELSVGLGGVWDRQPSQTFPTFVGALVWDYDETWWATPVIEGELGSNTDAAPCQPPNESDADTCLDAAVLGGLRFRRRPADTSGVRPFASAMLGSYWKGSGVEEPEFISNHFAMQFGGGVEFRWPGSIQGIRVMADWRYVFAGHLDRNQMRVLGLYVVGPRRFRAASASR